MVLAFSIFTYFPNAILIALSGVILLFLLKSINLASKLWVASAASAFVIALVSLLQIFSLNGLAEDLREREAVVDSLSRKYARLKSETIQARSAFSDSGSEVKLSRKELDELQMKVNAEFDRTVAEIRSVYADISDEELNRRVNSAVRKARRNLQTRVFQ